MTLGELEILLDLDPIVHRTVVPILAFSVPGPMFQFSFRNTVIRYLGDKFATHYDVGIGKSPRQARRDYARKLRGNILILGPDSVEPKEYTIPETLTA